MGFAPFPDRGIERRPARASCLPVATMRERWGERLILCQWAAGGGVSRQRTRTVSRGRCATRCSRSPVGACRSRGRTRRSFDCRPGGLRFEHRLGLFRSHRRSARRRSSRTVRTARAHTDSGVPRRVSMRLKSWSRISTTRWCRARSFFRSLPRSWDRLLSGVVQDAEQCVALGRRERQDHCVVLDASVDPAGEIEIVGSSHAHQPIDQSSAVGCGDFRAAKLHSRTVKVRTFARAAVLCRGGVHRLTRDLVQKGARKGRPAHFRIVPRLSSSPGWTRTNNPSVNRTHKGHQHRSLPDGARLMQTAGSERDRAEGVAQASGRHSRTLAQVTGTAVVYRTESSRLAIVS